MKVASMTLLKTILGTPVEAYRNAAPEERRNVHRVLQTMLPISRRGTGFRMTGSSPRISRDLRSRTSTFRPCHQRRQRLYGTYDSSFYTAEEIANAQFVGFTSGGHLLLGHEAEVRSQVRGFLAEQRRDEGDGGVTPLTTCCRPAVRRAPFS